MRGNDGRRVSSRSRQAVIPAKAGIQRLQTAASVTPWIPACAGMTAGEFRRASDKPSSPRRRGSRDFRVLPR
ncbi:hypothetical protein D9T17_02165 [Lysobacter enzymogenes]|uniref:Uncharacterized protein n=1 Tax=Lysobacter enzymogenes TaxID=69 RepID=A0A3N2RND2_LYSEN|nr:hypothetical protein D9T17_02165 [Lysobacter enzymogenes]